MKLSNSTKHAKKQAKLLKKKVILCCDFALLLHLLTLSQETAKSIAEALQKVKTGSIKVPKEKKSFSQALNKDKGAPAAGQKRKRERSGSKSTKPDP